MGLLKEFAFKIINHELGATYEDRIEAFQFVNDNFLLERLMPHHLEEFNFLVESGQIETAPWRNYES